MSRDRYIEFREENNRRLAGIFSAASDELTEFDMYTWESVSPNQAEVPRGAAVRMLSMWHKLRRQRKQEIHKPRLR